MHGAAFIAGRQDAEGDLLTAIRAAVGQKCMIAASYDLHGNVSQRVMKNLDLLTAYRTAPHIDWYETLERAAKLMVTCLELGMRPQKALIPVPILLTGEQSSTEWEPAQSLYNRIPEVIENFGILDASILIGYAWADEPRSMASVVAFGRDADAVQKAATELASYFWELRDQIDFGVTAASADDCIHTALSAPEQPVVISDSGDNPTAGGAGDVPFLLKRLLDLQVPDAIYASMADASAVAACVQAGVGGNVEISVGGKLDPIHGQPLPIQGRVLTLKTQPWSLYGSSADAVDNQIAVVQVNGIKVILTEQRTPFHHLDDFLALDINPTQHKILVVKIGYLVPELKKLAALSLLALSPGAVNQDIINLPYQQLQRPMYPFDRDMVWQPNSTIL